MLEKSEGPVFAFVLGLASLFFMSSCDDDEPKLGPPAGVWRRWQALPVQVEISDALTPCEKAAYAAAETFLETRTGRNLFEARTVPAHMPSVSGLPPLGVIGISNAPFERPGTLDEVKRFETKDGAWLHSVDMRVGPPCSMRSMAHELGHALGLTHAGTGRLMAMVYEENAIEISEEELAQVLP